MERSQVLNLLVEVKGASSMRSVSTVSTTSAPRLWLAIVVALLTALGFLAFGAYQQVELHRTADHRVDAVKHLNSQLISARCKDPSTAASCAAEIRSRSRVEVREIADLYSQETMALWTAIMGASATVGLALSGIGVFLIWQTWLQAGEASEYSRRTLQSYVGKERGILSQDIARVVTKGHIAHAGICVFFENIGASAATIVRVYFSYKDEVGVWPTEFDHEIEDVRTIAINGKGRTPCLEWSEPPEVQQSVYLQGVMEYRTLETEIFTTPFSLKITRFDNPYGSPEFEMVRQVVSGMPSHT